VAPGPTPTVPALPEEADAGARLQEWTCPVPLRDHEHVILGHGGGGRLQAELIEHLILPAFGGRTLTRLADAAVLDAGRGRLALTSDAHVVHPLEFPGGDIGALSVHGTINDLAMMGARPLALTAALIIEEGLAIDVLGRIITSMAAAARSAGVEVVAGDTKVVERGSADGLFITTTGLGVLADGVNIGPERARAGDVVLVSGPIGDHGIAILSVREGLEFAGELASDSAPLHELVAAMLAAAPGAVRVLRDPTRGGLASALNEIANSSAVAIELQEREIPVREIVASASSLLGLDPLYVPCEGRLTAIVDPGGVEAVLEAMRREPLGVEACVVGSVSDGPAGLVTGRTGIGGVRVIDLQIGEQLPRIC